MPVTSLLKAAFSFPAQIMPASAFLLPGCSAYQVNPEVVTHFIMSGKNPDTGA